MLRTCWLLVIRQGPAARLSRYVHLCVCSVCVCQVEIKWQTRLLFISSNARGRNRAGTHFARTR